MVTARPGFPFLKRNGFFDVIRRSPAFPFHSTPRFGKKKSGVHPPEPQPPLPSTAEIRSPPRLICNKITRKRMKGRRMARRPEEVCFRSGKQSALGRAIRGPFFSPQQGPLPPDPTDDLKLPASPMGSPVVRPEPFMTKTFFPGPTPVVAACCLKSPLEVLYVQQERFLSIIFPYPQCEIC